MLSYSKLSQRSWWIHDGKSLVSHRGESKRHPAFTAKWLSKILDTSGLQQWCHCPGKLNPADDGSHGLKAGAITQNCCWLNGPAFLLLSEDQWSEDIPKSKFAPDVT